MEEIKLSNLIKLDILQRMLHIFSSLTGMSAVCIDADGESITDDAGYPYFCRKYIRCTQLGKLLCKQCDKYGAELTREMNVSEPYICHAGLKAFTSPIVIEDRIIGWITGGQVLEKPMSEFDIRETAKELGLNPEELIDAARKITIRTREDIDKAAEYMHMLAGILSDIAYGNYISQEASAQLRNSSNMKSDFLANMSHEIRTPMNAVIGMAEMALREDMTVAARDYIGQIKSSGRALLNIINDILDYSKIESGKMELSCVEYEPLSLINDISSIIMTRLTDKPVEFLLDVDPNIPKVLYGDDLRIRQMIINLANNATKFTKHGHVQLKVRFVETAEDEILLKISVIDTGIGIKKDDINKLFSSFQQVDSKRNRNVEGTGLGLAITKNLISMMNGHIKVESEYEVGSTFSFDIPQKIVDKTPSIKLATPEKYALASFFSREDVADDFVSDSKKLCVYADDLSGSADPELSIQSWLKLHQDQKTYIIVDEKMFESTFANYFASNLDSGAGALLLAEAFSDVRQWNDMPYVNIIKKPFSVLNLAGFLEADACRFGNLNASNSDSEFKFIAPKARILIVDDNEINLTVAEGLLEPLKMQVDTAKSGKEALSKIDSTKYDIIFMDHMMPEMDGVETTRIIRRLHPDCKDVPIIALTANAVSGTKEMFLSEGMNDFIPKPIEVRFLISKVAQWLPADKKMHLSKTEIAENEERKGNVIPDMIGDLDVKSALGLLGSEKLFWKVFKDYYRVISSKADLIQQHYNEKNWSDYVVEVHALKSASKQIGANELSKLAASLESAGNTGNIDAIEKYTETMLEKYRSYIPVLAPYCEEEDSAVQKETIPEDLLKDLLQKMLDAVDNLDIVEMGNVVEEMDKYSLGEQAGKFEQLKNAVSDIDVDACEELVNSWFD